MHRKIGHVACRSAPGWAGRRVLEIAHRLNEQCIAALAEAAASDAHAWHFSPVAQLSELWRRLDGPAAARASLCPVLLVDLNFARADWWAPQTQSYALGNSDRLTASAFPIEIAREVLREVLIETWSTARSMPHAVCLLFGMTPEVCAAIASLKVSAIDRIVLEHAGQLRPRWAENLDFWRRLLEASIAANEEVVAELHLYALQLLGGNLIAPREDLSSPSDRALSS